MQLTFPMFPFTCTISQAKIGRAHPVTEDDMTVIRKHMTAGFAAVLRRLPEPEATEAAATKPAEAAATEPAEAATTKPAEAATTEPAEAATTEAAATEVIKPWPTVPTSITPDPPPMMLSRVKALQDDPREIRAAAVDAQKSSDWLIARERTAEQERPSPEPASREDVMAREARGRAGAPQRDTGPSR